MLLPNHCLAVRTLARSPGFTLLAVVTLGPPEDLQALARGFLSLYGIGLSIGFVFLSMGSAVFSYLWLKSRYIPPALAILGIFSSLLLGIMSLVTMAFPIVWDRVGIPYMMPMGLYEVGPGLWLLIKRLKVPLL